MIIEFKNWTNNSVYNFKSRTYVTVDGQEAGYVERSCSNTHDRDAVDTFTSTLDEELNETIVDLMKEDFVEYYGKVDRGFDDLDVFNMFQMAGTHKMTARDKRHWTAEFKKGWMNGIEI